MDYFAAATSCEISEGACSVEMMFVRIIGVVLIIALIVAARISLVKKKNKVKSNIFIVSAIILTLIVSYLYYDVISQKRYDAERAYEHKKCVENSRRGGLDCPV